MPPLQDFGWVTYLEKRRIELNEEPSAVVCHHKETENHVDSIFEPPYICKHLEELIDWPLNKLAFWVEVKVRNLDWVYHIEFTSISELWTHSLPLLVHSFGVIEFIIWAQTCEVNHFFSALKLVYNYPINALSQFLCDFVVIKLCFLNNCAAITVKILEIYVALAEKVYNADVLKILFYLCIISFTTTHSKCAVAFVDNDHQLTSLLIFVDSSQGKLVWVDATSVFAVVFKRSGFKCSVARSSFKLCYLIISICSPLLYVNMYLTICFV